MSAIKHAEIRGASPAVIDLTPGVAKPRSRPCATAERRNAPASAFASPAGHGPS